MLIAQGALVHVYGAICEYTRPQLRVFKNDVNSVDARWYGHGRVRNDYVGAGKDRRGRNDHCCGGATTFLALSFRSRSRGSQVHVSRIHIHMCP